MSRDRPGKWSVNKFVFHRGALSDLVAHVWAYFFVLWVRKSIGRDVAFFRGSLNFSRFSSLSWAWGGG